MMTRINIPRLRTLTIDHGCQGAVTLLYATCLAQVASEIARCRMPRNHKVTQQFCSKKHFTR